MKKYVIFPLFVILILCFFSGCSEIVNTPIKGGDLNYDTSISGGDLNYDTSIFNVPMQDVIEASKDFAKASILSESSRSVLFELSEEDKWQGYIEYNQWNVPSNVYGVNLNAADNKLVVNGEDLGTLQNLVHHKDEWGNYRKAVFEYNGYLYYVLDKEGYDGSYIVLSTEDDFEHICFDQDGKLNSPDFSNFKIWQWYEGPDGKMYRTGNLGYAYTLRNVKMQDGSYATVTVSGYNYYNYGLRVWIKPSTGNDVKIEYPIMDETNTSESFKYDTSMDMKKYFTSPEEASFVFEFTNKTGKNVEIYNFIYDSRVFNFDNSVVTKTESVIVKDNETVSFYYDAEKIINDFDDNFVFANYVEEKDCYWLYYYIDGSIGNKRIKVLMTNSEYNNGETHFYEDATPLGLDDYFASPETSDFLVEFINETENDLIIYNYISDFNYSRIIKTSDFLLEPGETKKIYYNSAKIKENYEGIFTLGTSQNGSDWWLTLGFFDCKHQKVTLYENFEFEIKEYDNFDTE